uniref:MADF domain-containing protein n=1 Tax=Graphocephala atropunctata TaxID=36148 RepID=A0A1B6LEL2_9HEMI
MHDETARCNFDTETFIFEVQARPSIWDVNSEEYGDRDLKRKCWLELAEMFIDKEDANKREMSEYCRALQRRWKSLRDCYTRECHRMAKRSETGCQHQRTYMYYRHLSFLSGVVKCKGMSSDTEEGSCGPSTVEIGLLVDGEEDGDDEDRSRPPESPAPLMAPTETRKRKRYDRQTPNPDPDEEDNPVNCVVKSRKLKQENEEDSERLFLLSLLEPIKDIPEKLRFALRMEIMKVVDNFRNKTIK